MKKTMFIIPLLLLLLCCGKQEHTTIINTNDAQAINNTPLPTEINGISDVSIESNVTTSNEEGAYPSYMFSHEELRNQLQSLPEYYPNWYGNTMDSSSTENSVTVREIQQMDGYSLFEYHNEKLDFASFKIEVVSFDPESQTEALRLHIIMPNDWCDVVKTWFQKEGLCIDFRVNQKHVNAFRQKKIQSADEGFDIVYQKCIMDGYDLSADSLEIVPYVKEIGIVWNPEKNDTLLIGGSIVEKTNEENTRIKQWDLVRHYLDNAKVSIPLKNNAIQRPPCYINFAIDVVDFEYLISLNQLFNPDYEGELDPPRGIIYERQKDINQISVIIDSTHIWKDELEISYSIYFPSDWTDAELYSVYSSDCGVSVYDESAIKQDLNQYGELWPIIDSSYANPFKDNWKSWREKHYTLRIVPCKTESFHSDMVISIIPYFVLPTVTVPKEGYIYAQNSNLAWFSSLEYKAMEQLVESIVIDPTLFDSGF